MDRAEAMLANVVEPMWTLQLNLDYGLHWRKRHLAVVKYTMAWVGHLSIIWGLYVVPGFFLCDTTPLCS